MLSDETILVFFLGRSVERKIKTLFYIRFIILKLGDSSFKVSINKHCQQTGLQEDFCLIFLFF